MMNGQLLSHIARIIGGAEETHGQLRAIDQVLFFLVPFSTRSSRFFLGGQMQEIATSEDQSVAWARRVNVLVYTPDGNVIADPSKDLAGFCSVCLAAGSRNPVTVYNVESCDVCGRLLCNNHRVFIQDNVYCPEHGYAANWNALASWLLDDEQF
jgi:hypothetical protein